MLEHRAVFHFQKRVRNMKNLSHRAEWRNLALPLPCPKAGAVPGLADFATDGVHLEGDLENISTISAIRCDNCKILEARGRESWALSQLIIAGPRGLTVLERPAPRWSHYIYLLRRRGLVIETIDERHGGVYPGRHGRYRLLTPVKVVAFEIGRAAA
jgi:hypothetical protein